MRDVLVARFKLALLTDNFSACSPHMSRSIKVDLGLVNARPSGPQSRPQSSTLALTKLAHLPSLAGMLVQSNWR